jgi:hypothetical protein
MEKTMDLEVNVKKVQNGYVVQYRADVDGDYVEESYVFTRFHQVVKFLKEKNLDK